jgi:hypothetical protein
MLGKEIPAFDPGCVKTFFNATLIQNTHGKWNGFISAVRVSNL